MRPTRDSEGFTLVEMLVVVVIVGILFAVAIPVYIAQQGSAEDVTVQSNLQQARIAMSAYISRNDGSITTDLGQLTDLGMTPTAATTLDVHPGAGNGQYCIDATASTQHTFRVSESQGVEPGAC